MTTFFIRRTKRRKYVPIVGCSAEAGPSARFFLNRAKQELERAVGRLTLAARISLARGK